MKQTLTVIMAGAAVATLGGGAANAQNVKIENAIARVVYMPEDRSDISVEVQQGNSALPALQVLREGPNVRIDGNIHRGAQRSRSMNCQSGASGATPPTSPGEGAYASTRSTGRIALADAPLVVIRGPRNTSLSTSGAVHGAVGRGAEQVKLSIGGCGNWVIANVSGRSDISIGGSGGVWTGSARELKVAIGGSGDVRSTAVQNLTVSIGGSGDIAVQRVDGDARISIAGSGDVDIADGAVETLSVSVMGSGDVEVGGTVRDVSASIAGSGDIVIERVTGNISQRALGSGRVRILSSN